MSLNKQTTDQKVDSEAPRGEADNKSDSALPTKLSGKKMLLIVIALMVVIIGVVAFGKNSGEQEEASKAPAATLEEIRVQSENKIGAKQYDEAVAVWEEFLKSSERSEEEKIQAHLGMALAYTNKQDHKLALEQYKKAEQISSEPRSDIVGGILSVAVQTEDKDLQREYLSKVIALLNPNDPLYEADKAAYENKLKELNAQPN